MKHSTRGPGSSAWVLLALAVAGCTTAAAVRADEGSAPPATAASPFGVASRLPDDGLEALRGGASSTTTVSTVVEQHGSVRNNSAVDVSSGSNAISGGAFANATGLSTVIQNSGTNVLIQSSTTVNVQFK